MLRVAENLLETESGGGGGSNSVHHVAKRFTVDFNGMQVSYPTYVRLSRLQVSKRTAYTDVNFYEIFSLLIKAVEKEWILA